MKKLALLVCLIFIVMSFVACGKKSDDSGSNNDINNGVNDGITDDNNSTNDNKDTVEDIVIEVSSTSVKVGDKITVTVKFNSVKQVKTIGLRPVFDATVFELVEGRMNITGAIHNFGDGIGVVAFDECIDLEGKTIMQFVLRAKTAATAEAIGCDVSVKGDGDKVIVISQPADVTVNVKAE